MPLTQLNNHRDGSTYEKAYILTENSAYAPADYSCDNWFEFTPPETGDYFLEGVETITEVPIWMHSFIQWRSPTQIITAGDGRIPISRNRLMGRCVITETATSILNEP